MIYRTSAMLSSREGSAASRGSLKKAEFTPSCGWGVLNPYTLGNVMLALPASIALGAFASLSWNADAPKCVLECMNYNYILINNKER